MTDMFSLLNEDEYLRLRKRQECIASRTPLDADEKRMQSFLAREERLQAYESTHGFRDDEAYIYAEISTDLLFKTCLLARRTKITVNQYIENRLNESLKKHESSYHKSRT